MIWHPATERDLTDGAIYCNRQQPGLGDEFIDEVVAASRIIADDPERAREFDPPYRNAPTGRFCY